MAAYRPYNALLMHRFRYLYLFLRIVILNGKCKDTTKERHFQIFLRQLFYVESIILRFWMQSCKACPWKDVSVGQLNINNEQRHPKRYSKCKLNVYVVR